MTKHHPSITMPFAFEAAISRPEAAKTLRDLRRTRDDRPSVIRRPGKFRIYSVGRGPCLLTIGI